jgi:hypothetical protein
VGGRRAEPHARPCWRGQIHAGHDINNGARHLYSQRWAGVSTNLLVWRPARSTFIQVWAGAGPNSQIHAGHDINNGARHLYRGGRSEQLIYIANGGRESPRIYLFGGQRALHLYKCGREPVRTAIIYSQRWAGGHTSYANNDIYLEETSTAHGIYIGVGGSLHDFAAIWRPDQSLEAAQNAKLLYISTTWRPAKENRHFFGVVD